LPTAGDSEEDADIVPIHGKSSARMEGLHNQRFDQAYNS
jgi:hypothetical protein